MSESANLRFRTIHVLEILRRMAVERLTEGSSLEELLRKMYMIAIDAELHSEMLRRLERGGG